MSGDDQNNDEAKCLANIMDWSASLRERPDSWLRWAGLTIYVMGLSSVRADGSERRHVEFVQSVSDAFGLPKDEQSRALLAAVRKGATS